MRIPLSRSHIKAALDAATDTRALRIGCDVLDQAPDLFRSQFKDAPALIVADFNTFEAAGKTVHDAFGASAGARLEPFIYADAGLYAEDRHVDSLQAVLANTDAIPVAVGSGTLNDLTKLAAHRAGRPYMVIATAASMDGYTAFGASIIHDGSKQTFACPAPRAVLADLEVMARAPAEMNASGYADLLAKVTAGADWILADALGEEAIDPTAWGWVQTPLRQWIADPSGVRKGDLAALENLVEGLMMGGFAMQRTRSSRCASGAEHQFSHLWDMQHHAHHGRPPSHGFKVGVATLAVTRLYEHILSLPLDQLCVEDRVSKWPEWPELEKRIRAQYDIPEIAAKAAEESRAKYIDRKRLRIHLEKIKEIWPGLREKLWAQIIPATGLRTMLDAAGAPCDPSDIGVTSSRLRDSFRQAGPIRRRYTILDFAVRSGLLESSLKALF